MLRLILQAAFSKPVSVDVPASSAVSSLCRSHESLLLRGKVLSGALSLRQAGCADGSVLRVARAGDGLRGGMAAGPGTVPRSRLPRLRVWLSAAVEFQAGLAVRALSRSCVCVHGLV